MAITHQLTDKLVYYAWDNAVAPQLTVDPGDTVICETRDSADYYYNADSTHDDVARKGPLKGHPLAGPIYVRGAAPGDTLVVDILEVKPRLGFGWTAIRPGRGLLPQTDFSRHFLQIWDIAGTHAQMRGRPDVTIPVQAFPGIIGTALAEPGPHSTIPPRANGGNMDIKHLTAGTRLYLPVSVEGALLSVGDAHAAQGDGEVCITAIEMAATMALKIGLEQGRRIAEPQLRVPGPLCCGTAHGPFFAVTSHGPDLFANAQQAVRYLIDHLTVTRGLSREQAYILCSVCADLKVNQIVDAPNWTVSAFLPENVFASG